ncbi:MAG: hypothetical protein LBU13_11485 [Synergistaceae bacterium]|jgi:hypothetical protein|nr:hypothetical protein [Synergistaceae bacterium]
MFDKIEISLWRAFFWPVVNLIYWGLIFLAWWDTRFKVFLGVSFIKKFGELRSYSAAMSKFAELEGEARIAVAQSGVMQSEFIMIPLVMAVVLFMVPFVVRRDHKGPVGGVIVLPAMTILCYVFASFLNVIVVAAMSAGIHYLLFKVPGPDMFMFMVHPLYLIFPLFRSIPGLLSQCLYFVYAATVLSADSRYRHKEEDKEFEDYGCEQDEYDDSDEEDDWDRSACVMEMDRLTRIINTKFETQPFIERLRADIAKSISNPRVMKDEVGMGQAHYKIILTETKNSLMRILKDDPETPKVREALAFVVDEMARMQFISPEDASAMKNSVKRESTEEKIIEEK